MTRMIFCLFLSCSAIAADYIAQYEIAKRQRLIVSELSESGAISDDLLQLGVITGAIFDGATLLYVLDNKPVGGRDIWLQTISDLENRQRARLNYATLMITNLRTTEPRLAVRLGDLQREVDAMRLMQPASASSAP